MMNNYKRYTKRGRYIDIQKFYLQQWFNLGLIFLEYSKSELNPSDVSTKVIV